jgi:selenocysteine lyase/cysteine desulfurase
MAGASPVTMSQWGADALVCSGYKWLSAPGGVALLAVTEDLAAMIPPLVGWMGKPAPFDFTPQELSLAPPGDSSCPPSPTAPPQGCPHPSSS